MQHVPASDCRAGTALERADPERAPGGIAALQRALRTRQGAGGQDPVVTPQRTRSTGSPAPASRGGTARAGELRADARGTRIRRAGAGHRTLGARAARDKAPAAITITPSHYHQSATLRALWRRTAIGA